MKLNKQKSRVVHTQLVQSVNHSPARQIKAVTFTSLSYLERRSNLQTSLTIFAWANKKPIAANVMHSSRIQLILPSIRGA